MDRGEFRAGEAVQGGLSRAVQGVEADGPPAAPKVHIGFRLAADVVNGIRATGKGYNARVEKVLREALAEGKL